MSKVLSRLPARLAALALLGLAACSIGVRPASAMGCHVEQRPTLGLSDSWEDWTRSAPAGSMNEMRRSPRVDRIPCPADPPGSPERFNPAGPALGSAIGFDDEIRPARWVEPKSAVLARHRPTAPDRPPRG